jgi:biopolymer transport protein ExbB/TolQ
LFPVVLGGLMSFVFYAAIHKGWICQPLMVRYFAGHPIEYITTAMFFIGIAILAVKYTQVSLQRKALKSVPVLEPYPQSVPITAVHADIEYLLKHEKEKGSSPLTVRLKPLLHLICRSRSAANLDGEIRNLAEDAAVKADTDYGLVRLILWAVPMLGFLGTVIGITAALDNLDLNAINESSQKLSAGLAVAFDTTGLAIALDVLLFFVQFLVHREEMNLLAETDRLADAELRGRYEPNHGKEDEQFAFVKKILETMTGTIEQMTARQTAALEELMTAADRRYADMTAQSADTLKISLAAALNENLGRHAESLAIAESELLLEIKESARQYSDTLRQNTSGILLLQQETARQTETVRNVLESRSQLLQLEHQLKNNLSVLANVGNFEETVNSLAAAIHLLNSNRRSELKAV